MMVGLENKNNKILYNIVGIYVSHKEVGVEKLGGLFSTVRKGLDRCLSDSRGYVVLSTCNRIEIYVDTNMFDKIECLERVFRNAGVDARVVRGIDTVRRIMRIASGLESKILGESEILGQVKRAWLSHRERGVTSKWLDMVFHAAILAGKRVRSETCIGSGSVGYPSIAVSVAAERLNGLVGKKILVIGTGDAATRIVSILCSSHNPLEIHIFSRSLDRARLLVGRCSCCRVFSPESSDYSSIFDVVFVAADYAKDYISNIIDSVKSRLIVDITIPSLFDEKNNIINYKTIEMIAMKSIEMRKSCLEVAESIIDEEVDKLIRRIAERDVSYLLHSLNKYIYKIIDEQSGIASRKLGIDESIIEYFIEKSVKKAIHPIMIAIREASRRGDPSAIIGVLEEVLADAGR